MRETTMANRMRPESVDRMRETESSVSFTALFLDKSRGRTNSKKAITSRTNISCDPVNMGPIGCVVVDGNQIAVVKE